MQRQSRFSSAGMQISRISKYPFSNAVWEEILLRFTATIIPVNNLLREIYFLQFFSVFTAEKKLNVCFPLPAI
jgi:carbon starvation protein CstA